MKTFRIKEICHLEKGKQIDTTLLNDCNPYKYINGGIKESGYYSAYNTEGEAVLVSEGGASCGYVNYINEKFWCGCHCYKLTKCKFLPKYIYYALKGNQEKLMALRTGAAMPNIKKTTFQDMELCLNENPAEQEMVIKELDKIQIALDIKETELIALDDLVKSRFIEMFGTFPSNEHSWDTGTIRDIVTDVKYGSSRKAATGNNGKYPYLRMNNITYDGHLDLSDVKTIDIPDNEVEKCSVRYGDILFNRTNSRELVGKTCVYNRNELMILAGFIIRVRVNERIIPEFLSAFLNMDFSKQMLFGMCKKAIGQANINAQEMQSIGIYIPPIELQNEFAEFVKLTDKSKFIVQKQIEDLQELLDSKMDEYFG